MDRKIIYSGQIPLETDLLGTNRNALVALGKLMGAMFGSSATFVNGMACSPNSPADMTVKVAHGQIYSLQNIDDTAYSSIAADTAHQIIKQGIALDTTSLSCPAPGTASFSINYLVQVAFAEVDSTPTVLPYYNAANPSQAFNGPNNAGTAQNTVRADTAIITVKAGTAASTGSQTTPSPDANNVGLWVVTVANGQTSIVAGNITQYSGAPFIPQGGAIWNAKNSYADKSVGGNSDITLTAQEAVYPIIDMIGTLTGNINVIVPATSGQWVMRNSTTGNFSLTVKTAAGTGIQISQGKSMVLYSEGVNVYVAGAANDVSFTKTSFTATAGQTLFTGLSYTPGNLWVTRNGVNVAFTATDGTTVTLGVAANLNDLVEVYQLTSFTVANALTQTSGDARYILQTNEATAASDPTFADNSTKVASTNWVRGLIPTSSGSFTITGTGFTTTVTATATYKIINGIVFLKIPRNAITGTSNAVTFTLTGLPAAITPAVQLDERILSAYDSATPCWALAEISGSGIALYKNAVGNAWTASGTKALYTSEFSWSL